MEGDGEAVAGVFGGLLDSGVTAEDDQVGQRDSLVAGLCVVEVFLHALERLQNLGQLLRLVDRPILLRREPDARAVSAATVVGAAERRGRSPGGRGELGDRQSGRQDLVL